MKKLISSLLLVTLLLPGFANAWWNGDWSQRRKVALNTTAKGTETKTLLSSVTIPVRLHSGNFSFADAKEDGSDIRFVSGDDKTPLKAHVESFDSVNEIAIVWVQIPALAPQSDKDNVWVYFGNPKATAEDSKGSFDSSYGGVFHFGPSDSAIKDASSAGVAGTGAIRIEKNGLMGAGLALGGDAVKLDPSVAMKRSDGGELTVSAWLKLSSAGPDSTLFTQESGGKAIHLGISAGKLVASIVGGSKPVKLAGPELKADGWHHIAFTVGSGNATLYLDGVEVTQGAAALPELDGGASVGGGMVGVLDELELSTKARSADWIRVAYSSQGPDTHLLSVSSEDEGGGGGNSYFGILISNLTTDAWVVIIILMIMFAISAAVMVAKTRFILRTVRGNHAFLQQFRDAGHDFLNIDAGASQDMTHSPLFHLHKAGAKEVEKRFIGTALESEGSRSLSAQSINAIKATIDADLVRENHRLNANMVLLTIAISGGPFLGLLGTVVGVMITFAAIAAAGDVNVNSIAPGIAAALLATVAGLGVAIPALFGYNYLASKIKNITSEMQIFVDEFVTRVAEKFSN